MSQSYFFNILYIVAIASGAISLFYLLFDYLLEISRTRHFKSNLKKFIEEDKGKFEELRKLKKDVIESFKKINLSDYAKDKELQDKFDEFLSILKEKDVENSHSKDYSESEEVEKIYNKGWLKDYSKLIDRFKVNIEDESAVNPVSKSSINRIDPYIDRLKKNLIRICSESKLDLAVSIEVEKEKGIKIEYFQRAVGIVKILAKTELGKDVVPDKSEKYIIEALKLFNLTQKAPQLIEKVDFIRAERLFNYGIKLIEEGIENNFEQGNVNPQNTTDRNKNLAQKIEDEK